MNTPNPPTYSSPPSSGPNPSVTPPWWRDPMKVAIVAVVGVFAIIVTALLLILVNGGPAEGATASASPSPSSSTASLAPSPTTSEPTSSVEPSSSIDPSPTPSASAVPSDPPQAELTQGWARIKTGLNLRDGASAEYAIVAKLPPGEVVWVNSGPYREDADDQLDWYNVETLNDKYGWIASGSPDDPNATTISQQFRFQSCGPVGITGSQGVVNGLRTPRLNDVELATFELAIATGTRGCMRFSNEDYEPKASLDLSVHACGAPSWDGSVGRLQPTTAGDVDASWRVSSTLDIPAILLTYGQREDAEGVTNLQKLLTLGRNVSSPFTCIKAQVVRGGNHRKQTINMEVADCLVMISKGPAGVTFAPAGGDPVTLLRYYRDHLAEMPFNDPARLRLIVSGTLNSEVLGDC